ncbi:hypothetical protein Ddye_005291 [Dipteronia dyeriana]|uniref:Transposase n=1 Tax=Dipteronia dyeriana TaxID=168575 RepID=A0AAD9XG70_9ROSI|nr:hypothetical protein Ddye_005291 [Dipteronia dyeriana]
MVQIFLDATHGFCAYHLAQNLRKMCNQRDDVIKLYYRATYTYCIEEFECEMAELKDTHREGEVDIESGNSRREKKSDDNMTFWVVIVKDLGF